MFQFHVLDLIFLSDWALYMANPQPLITNDLRHGALSNFAKAVLGVHFSIHFYSKWQSTFCTVSLHCCSELTDDIHHGIKQGYYIQMNWISSWANINRNCNTFFETLSESFKMTRVTLLHTGHASWCHKLQIFQTHGSPVGIISVIIMSLMTLCILSIAHCDPWGLMKKKYIWYLSNCI